MSKQVGCVQGIEPWTSIVSKPSPTACGHGMAEAVGAPDGWQLGLRRFAEFVAK